ncbi:metal-dependent hydrolase [Pontibacter actiniarum]|uniref:Metal-dependent hydrolase n=1 Tax=Pontibacter actiniarum TaxID=323450 RepID=A0A1X9YYC2_9BACT|nr:metal-dependent hydrolase [Pontibacter actiniarum]
MEKLKYPIGRYNPQQELSEQELAQAILAIAQLPQKLRTAVANLTPEQLDTPYRDGGWTVRQVIHHLPDSHLNGYMRQKLALTEDVPTIRPYDEVAWAALPDSLHGDPGISLRLLEALHQRWVLLLQSLTPEQLARKFTHPASGGQSIRQHIGNYAWHGNHHLAHVTELIRREGWDKA